MVDHESAEGINSTKANKFTKASDKRECIKASDVTGTSHFMQTFSGSLGAIQKRGQTVTNSRPFEFAKYKAPQFEGPIHKLPRARAAESDDGEMPAENLGDLLGQVSKNLTGEIDSLIGELEQLRRKLQNDGDRIQREIEEHRALSQQVMQLTKIISESVEKLPTVRASVDR